MPCPAIMLGAPLAIHPGVIPSDQRESACPPWRGDLSSCERIAGRDIEERSLVGLKDGLARDDTTANARILWSAVRRGGPPLFFAEA